MDGVKVDGPKYPYYLLAVLTMIVWIRLLSYLRLFKQTRALIRLVIEVGKDMGAFAVVLSMAVLAFAITYNIVENSLSPDNTFTGSLSTIYLIMYGDF